MMGPGARNGRLMGADLSLRCDILQKCLVLTGLLILCGLTSIPAAAESISKPALYQSDWGVAFQHFRWAEYGEDDIRLLEETGFLYGLTQELAYRKGVFGWRQGAGLFLGEVDYDGYTWDFDPIQTDVAYIMGNIYLDFEPACQWPSGFLVKGILGLAGRLWLRDLDDTKTELGTRVGGVEEWWWSLYARAGAGLEYPLGQMGRIFGDAGIKLPIYARNDATFFVQGSPGVDLAPEPAIAPFAKIGWRWKKIKVCLFYDTLRFDASDRVKSGTYELYQPESEADMIGLDLSYTFYF